jgi:5-(carboxyamino)imidazole ribonucleotide synthase
MLVQSVAENASAITVEAESIAPGALDQLHFRGVISPGVEVQRIVQDRRLEKTFLAEHGLAVGPFRLAENAEGLDSAVRDLLETSSRVVAKTARGGYDGRGQIWIESPEQIESAWHTLGRVPLVVESAVDFTAEISVIVARNNRGETCVFPVLQNEHRGGVLFQTQIPAPQPLEVIRSAQELAVETAEALGVIGLLTVEMFVLPDGRVWINELAARPHNSGHVTMRATSRSQFEMHVCALMGLPLAPVGLITPGVMTNLLGDLWSADDPDFTPVLAHSMASVHLYGKEPRPGRKMGHMIHVAATLEDAKSAADQAYATLRGADARA